MELQFRNLDEKLNNREKKLTKLAEIAWSRTMAVFYFPPLNTPNYVFDYTQKEGFYIDPEFKWQITMNLANTPLLNNDDEYIQYFHLISMHEVSHYEIIPYDGIIHARLLRAAMKYINHHFAPIIVNLFSDLIIDKKLYQKFPDLVTWELRKSYEYISTKYEDKFSDFSKFLYRTYENILNICLLDETLQLKIKTLNNIMSISVSNNNSIMNESLTSKKETEQLELYNSLSNLDHLAKEVTRIVLNNFENESLWEKKVSMLSKVLKDLILNTFSLKGKKKKANDVKISRRSPSNDENYIEFTEDILEVMDNPLEIKNRDKIKEINEDELRQKAEDFAKDTPFSEFGSPSQQAGILRKGDHLATWYRGLAKNLIQIKIIEKKPSGEVPVSINTWRIGDPFEELDLVQTLLTCPIIIPNITTKKWMFKEGSGQYDEKKIPDLLIVLDSSGSMGWNYMAKSSDHRGPYHTALLAAFAALHFAASKGVKFSVINFAAHADISPWSMDYQKAEQILLRYQGSGTILPIKAISNQCVKAEKPVLILIITDFGIYNWKDAKDSMIELVHKGHKIVGFFIGADSISKPKFKALLDKVTFYPVKNPNYLIDLVIEEVKKYYF